MKNKQSFNYEKPAVIHTMPEVGSDDVFAWQTQGFELDARQPCDATSIAREFPAGTPEDEMSATLANDIITLNGQRRRVSDWARPRGEPRGGFEPALLAPGEFSAASLEIECWWHVLSPSGEPAEIEVKLSGDQPRRTADIYRDAYLSAKNRWLKLNNPGMGLGNFVVRSFVLVPYRVSLTK